MMAAMKPDSDLRAAKGGEGRGGVYLPNSRPKTEAHVSAHERLRGERMCVNISVHNSNATVRNYSHHNRHTGHIGGVEVQAEDDTDEVPNDAIDLFLFRFAHEKAQNLFVDDFKLRIVQADNIGRDDDAQEN